MLTTKGEKKMVEKIAEILKDKLDIDNVTAESDFKKDLEIDSLDLFDLVMSLEETFGVEIPSEDLESIATVGDMVNYLKEHGAQ